MYQQQQQQLQSHQQHLSSRHSLPPEKQFLLHGGGDSSGLILSTDAKPRLKWTAELHERFLEAVNQLGGPEKATPKTIMRLMGIPGLTLYHLKSHLQKYRLSKNLQAQANAVHAKNVSGCRTATDKPYDENVSPASQSQFTLEPQINCRSSVHISEALQMQIEAQRRLQEQLEVQRHMQLRIEAQGKYLQSVLEKAQEALAAKNGSSVDDDADVVLGLKQQQLPELAAKRLRHEHTKRQHGVGAGSVDSCLTTCEGGSHHSRPFHQQLRLGEEEEAAADRRILLRSRASDQEYMLFLEEPPSGGAAISPDDHRCDCERYGDGFFGSATTIRPAELDLDLSIINNRTGTCPSPRPRDSIIDLNSTGSA